MSILSVVALRIFLDTALSSLSIEVTVEVDVVDVVVVLFYIFNF
jgi:hypothetical protein